MTARLKKRRRPKRKLNKMAKVGIKDVGLTTKRHLCECTVFIKYSVAFNESQLMFMNSDNNSTVSKKHTPQSKPKRTIGTRNKSSLVFLLMDAALS